MRQIIKVKLKFFMLMSVCINSRKNSGTCLLLGKPKNEQEIDHPLQKRHLKSRVEFRMSHSQLSEKPSLTLAVPNGYPSHTPRTTRYTVICLYGYNRKEIVDWTRYIICFSTAMVHRPMRSVERNAMVWDPKGCQ